MAKLQLAELRRRFMEACGIEISWTDEGIDALLDRAVYDPTLGA